MGGSTTYPTWRGVTVCTCMPAPLDELARLTGQGFKVAPIPGYGSYSSNAASAGIDTGGGHIDLDLAGYGSSKKREVETLARSIGWYAAAREPRWWSRWFGKWIQPGWAPHLHMLLKDCPHLSTAARAQLAQWHAGGNGLAGKDVDEGDRRYMKVTWWSYLAAKNPRTATGGVYTVKAGDTLGAIAASFKVTVAQLQSWNGIKDPNVISVGQKVRVVALAPPKPAPKPMSVQKPAPKPAGLPTLKRGSNSATVKKLQAELLRVFFYAKPIKSPGGGPITKFGPSTEKVVREFQKRAGITIDGIVGPETWAALKANGVRM